MVSMDFINCSKYRSIKSCCSEKSLMDDENKNNEFRNKDCIFLERKNKIEDGYSTVNVEPLRFVKNVRMKGQINGDLQEESFSSFNMQEDKDFRCPRCGQSMQEPRLLPCLHPICSTCISELMSKPFYNFTKSIKTQNNKSESSQNNYYEICPLCDVQLPNANSTVPPPHYPLQYRLVMSAIRSKFTNKILCDICPDEVVAVVQCSTCLRNFCLDCGMKHQQQITLELKPLKHSIRPLMEATKVRRTALCQQHPTHALRFYCIACQQVTCKECMWSSQHRGHASENAAGVAKRVILYLTKMLQRAKILLNMLLTQYDRDAFLNSSFEEIKDTSISVDYRYVKLIIF
ncbi:tripartite motif-containing protein 45-like [Bombus bifarius]|uniref:Tripartite motif-containing protein 45-like n=1 Tax=Bombus bifarius TaxID=103933 RepID=A0A6P8M0E7_9HYME|nr:tripartite motif-containing protein 45-like [Bombus bifarius]XP_033306892.1 tripartite motif-containing protein 45-like [Bombus bifarius]